jgi:hypothetical protein
MFIDRYAFYQAETVNTASRLFKLGHYPKPRKCSQPVVGCLHFACAFRSAAQLL